MDWELSGYGYKSELIKKSVGPTALLITALIANLLTFFILKDFSSNTLGLLQHGLNKLINGITYIAYVIVGYILLKLIVQFWGFIKSNGKGTLLIDTVQNKMNVNSPIYFRNGKFSLSNITKVKISYEEKYASLTFTIKSTDPLWIIILRFLRGNSEYEFIVHIRILELKSFVEYIQDNYKSIIIEN